IGNLSFRPVALRPRLSTGLPLTHARTLLSDRFPPLQCQSVARRSQVLKCVAALKEQQHIIWVRGLTKYVSMRRRYERRRSGAVPESPGSDEVLMVITRSQVPVRHRLS